MTERDEIRQRIVVAAVTCLERDGLERVTVRSVAREAGVNVAAISYYFGGKTALMQAALELTLETGFDLSELDEAIARTGDLRGSVEWFLLDYQTHMLAYPRVAEAHLHGPLMGAPFPAGMRARIEAFVAGFAERVAPLLGDASPEARAQAVTQIWSAIYLPGLLPGFFAGAGVDVTDAAARGSYVRALVERYLGPAA